MKPRATPITHKHFDVTELIRRFGQYNCATFQKGIEKTWGMK
jgi:hypothetical protein